MRTRAPGRTRASSASDSSARHSSRPWRIRRSSSAPAITTWPGCTMRLAITPSSGARSAAKSRRSCTPSRCARAVAWRASACTRVARSSSKALALISFSLASIWPRARLVFARATPASASLAAACAWRNSLSSVRWSSSSSTWPLRTCCPTSTLSAVTRTPLISTPSCISSQADTGPDASRLRSIVVDCARVRLTARLAAGASAVVSASGLAPQAGRTSVSASARPAR